MRANTWHVSASWLAGAIATSGVGLAQAPPPPPAPPAPPAAPAPPPARDSNAGVTVLTHGPVHEAFAEPVVFSPQPGIVVTQAPPAPIDEVPPGVKPDASVWIPGYWAWDDGRQNFLWVSGFWRVPPADHQWVPGYWARVPQGYQWVPGYWTRVQVTEVEYLPPPPATLETGPSVPAPSPDYIWIPGCWVWHQGTYAWRPGYWAAAEPDWEWVAAHYVWAPPGYIFIEGYWDYDLEHRGVLFAPVYFDGGAYTRPGFHYSPSVVIDVGLFAGDLFVRPRYSHYYFGDYYAPDYEKRGFYASFEFESKHYGYDPIYLHERWRHRTDHDWDHHLEAEFQHRRDHEDARPPRTWTALRELLTKRAGSGEKVPAIAAPLDQVLKRASPPLHFQPLAREQLQQLAQQLREVHTFRRERRQLEATAASKAPESPDRPSQPARLKLRESPILGSSHSASGGVPIPPKAHEIPKPEPRAVPRPEQPRGELKEKPANGKEPNEKAQKDKEPNEKAQKDKEPHEKAQKDKESKDKAKEKYRD
jgi:hypothetical protein